MKNKQITKNQLKRIIKEELMREMQEAWEIEGFHPESDNRETKKVDPSASLEDVAQYIKDNRMTGWDDLIVYAPATLGGQEYSYDDTTGSLVDSGANT